MYRLSCELAVTIFFDTDIGIINILMKKMLFTMCRRKRKRKHDNKETVHKWYTLGISVYHLQMQALQHLSHTTVAPEVTTHKTSPLSLYHFQFVNVRFCMRVPDGGTIFNLGSDKAFVAELFDGHSTVTQISLQGRECLMATSSCWCGCSKILCCW